MKILVIPTWFATDRNKMSGIFVSEQSKALIETGADVHILFADFHLLNIFNRHKWFTHIDTTENEVPVFRVNGFALPKRNKFLTDLWINFYHKAFRLYLQFHSKPDLIHSHSYFAGLVALRIQEIYGIPYMITEHHSGFMDDSIPKWQVPLIKKVYNKSSAIIAVSSSLKKKLLEYTQSEIEVISNLVLTEELEYTEIHPAANAFKIISVGSLIERKGFDTLIEAIGILCQQSELKKIIQLTIIGEGTERRKLEQLISMKNLNKNIHLVGYCPHKEVKDFLKNSKLYVSSSHAETQGVAVIEALCCGLPVIGTSIDCMTDIIDDYNGRMVTARNAPELAQAIELVIENYVIFNKKEIRSNAVLKYGAETIVAQIKRIYSKILNL